MNFSLAPYNLYILRASAVLLVIFLIILLAKSVSLLKAIKEKKPVIDQIRENVSWAKIKTEAMKEQREEEKSKDKYFRAALPFLLAIYEAMRQDRENHGVKKATAAVHKVAADRRYGTRILDTLKHQS